MHQGGFDIVAACDSDETATLTYLVNLGAYPVDIRYLSPEDEERFKKAVIGENRSNGWIVGKDGAITGRKDGKLVDKWGHGPLTSGYNREAVLGPDRSGCGTFFFGDVRNLTGEMVLDAIGMERGEVDIVFGGPPCQGFSTSGKRDVMDPRNSLVFEFMRLCLEIAPKTICMENVPGIVDMTTPEGIPVMEALLQILEEGGFGTYNALRQMVQQSSGVALMTRKTTTKKAKQLSEEELKQSAKRAEADHAPGRVHPLVQQALFGDAA